MYLLTLYCIVAALCVLRYQPSIIILLLCTKIVIKVILILSSQVDAGVRLNSKVDAGVRLSSQVGAGVRLSSQVGAGVRLNSQVGAGRVRLNSQVDVLPLWSLSAWIPA